MIILPDTNVPKYKVSLNAQANVAKKVMRIRPCNTFMRIITQNLVDIIGYVPRIFSIFVTE